MPAKIMVRYGEIALKGKNRGQFEHKLQRNMKKVLQDCQATVKRERGRFMVSGVEEYRDIILERLSKVFGVVSVSLVEETSLDLAQIKKLAAEIVNKLPPEQNKFRVETRRVNKQFPYPSPEMNQILGSHLQEQFPHLIVNLKQPTFTLSLELGYKKAYLYLDQTAGLGGLPVGITGRGLLLLSGGIDSPVAGWLAMKRGLMVEALHFHSFPFTSRRSQEKVVDLCRNLAGYGGKISLHSINIANIQKELRSQCPDELSVILLRRMMIRLAGLLSERYGLQAMITGESLGQVASQTLESIDVVSKATEMLILRPLIGMDKKEIIDKASTIGTYQISILPYEDCCTVFMPKSPVTKPSLEVIENHEAKLDLDGLLEKAINSLETTHIHPTHS